MKNQKLIIIKFIKNNIKHNMQTIINIIASKFKKKNYLNK